MKKVLTHKFTIGDLVRYKGSDVTIPFIILKNNPGVIKTVRIFGLVHNYYEVEVEGFTLLVSELELELEFRPDEIATNKLYDSVWSIEDADATPECTFAYFYNLQKKKLTETLVDRFILENKDFKFVDIDEVAYRMAFRNLCEEAKEFDISSEDLYNEMLERITSKLKDLV